MDYKIVTLQKKTVAGLKIRTSNSDPNMSHDIGALWQEFYEKGVYESIPGKVNDKAIGLYTNYENGTKGNYDMLVCCEISEQNALPENFTVKTIPAGKYARFDLHGDMQVVAQCWGEIWQMNLNRNFDCDFEEYRGCDPEVWDISIYISLN